jgi:acetylornithine deacetylase/succinyl-diaminopimelate desuccinylase-like protein
MSTRLQDQVAKTLLALLRTPSGVPRNAHELEAGDPLIRAAVTDVVAPLVAALKPSQLLRHDAGDLVAWFGPPGEAALLIQTYIVSQHGNDHADALASHLEDGAPRGVDGPVAVGQGASQNKGPMAAVLTALTLVDLESLRRPLIVAVNTEGRSSHDGSRRIIDDLGARADAALLAFGTGLDVSVANRGRVDVVVEFVGRSAHSSQPDIALNPIPIAAEVITALRTAPLPPPHPQLGGATATPYQLVFHPVAPHTIPSSGRLIVDRRLLPGESPGRAVIELEKHLIATVGEGFTVREGAVMLPALVDEAHPVVRSVLDSLASSGRPHTPVSSRNTFDAGYGCSLGMPTVMFGPGRRAFGDDVVQEEWVSIDDVTVAARAIADAVQALCG